MLRALVGLLLLANLAFFAWTHGALAPVLPPPHQGEHEPERLAGQVRAAAVTVLAPQAASAAVSAARAAAAVCLQAGPFDEAELASAEAAVASAPLPAGSWTRQALPVPPLWLVYAGKPAEAAVRRAREDELRKLGLAFEPLAAPPELAPGLVLSRHDSREAAEAALKALPVTLRGVRVVSLPPPPQRQWLRVPQADSEAQARLQALPSATLAGGFKPCPPPP